MAATTAFAEQAVLARLAPLDRLLPLWIAVAMAAGLLVGTLVPGVTDVLEALEVGGTSLPIFLGLLAMMYPVLARVRYEELGRMRDERRLLVASLVLNWAVGPALMFAVAWIFLADQPAYRTGLIIVGLARCIAMVLIWSELARADREATAVLVAINSLFQIAAYSLLGYFYLTLLPGWLGLDTQGFEVSLWEVARTVLIFLGVPLVAGYLTRVAGLRRRGREWYERRFVPRVAPVALFGLLFTIVLLFALQGEQVTDRPLDVALIAVPLLVYFAVMFAVSFAAGHRLALGYRRTASLAFTAASNNFEAGHRGGHRRVRRDLGPGARRRRGSAHRGARPGRPRLRRAVVGAAAVRRRGPDPRAGRAGLRRWPASSSPACTTPAARR